jgi:hypothetical protein
MYRCRVDLIWPIGPLNSCRLYELETRFDYVIYRVFLHSLTQINRFTLAPPPPPPPKVYQLITQSAILIIFGKFSLRRIAFAWASTFLYV